MTIRWDRLEAIYADSATIDPRELRAFIDANRPSGDPA